MTTPKPGATIELSQLTKTYGAHRAVDQVSLSVRSGEFMTLLGPSGSGKTTTLSLIAGFTAPDSGSIRIAGEDVSRRPAHQRDLGVVFQNYALFPHLSVADNVAFPLKQRRMSKSQRITKVREALEMVHLGDLGGRRPAQLSGGQQQRVALARAIAFQPAALLMDEPLGALDRSLRDSMQLEIRRIHREVGSTVVFVTHDQEEALALSDRIAVFNDGRLEQVGTGVELYERPSSMFIATFLGESTQIRGQVGHDSRGTYVEGRDKVWAPGDLAVGTEAAVLVRPERLTLRDKGATCPADHNSVDVFVLEELYLGASRKLSVELFDGSKGLVREPAGQITSVHAGDHASLTWQVDDGVLLETDTPPRQSLDGNP